LTAIGTITFERPQDLKKKLVGTITIEDTHMVGKETKFTVDYKVGDIVHFPNTNIPNSVVKEIKSDTEVELETPIIGHDLKDYKPYYRIPKMSTAGIYQSVWKQLERGQSMAIFPEGGSHDQTDLLPLKAGVTIMALGAMA
jgi:hypothetical protein